MWCGLIEVIQASFEDSKHNLVVHPFIAIHQHVAKRRHVLKGGQTLPQDDSLLREDQEEIPIPGGLAPPLEGDEMVADVEDLLDGKVQVALDEGPGSDIGAVFPPVDIFGGSQGIDIFLQS